MRVSLTINVPKADTKCITALSKCCPSVCPPAGTTTISVTFSGISLYCPDCVNDSPVGGASDKWTLTLNGLYHLTGTGSWSWSGNIGTEQGYRGRGCAGDPVGGPIPITGSITASCSYGVWSVDFTTALALVGLTIFTGDSKSPVSNTASDPACFSGTIAIGGTATISWT